MSLEFRGMLEAFFAFESPILFCVALPDAFRFALLQVTLCEFVAVGEGFNLHSVALPRIADDVCSGRVCVVDVVIAL